MSQEKRGPRENSGDGKGLNSTEYRHRLLNKLNCLIAVLEVAIGKIAKSLTAEDANHDRLVRIKSNLENTLGICRRAKQTLETKLLEDNESEAPKLPSQRPSKENLAFRCYVELSSIDEFRKFKELPAITEEEVRGANLDDLARQLLDDNNG